MTVELNKEELARLSRAADVVDIQQLQSLYIQYLDQDDMLGIYGLMAKDHPEVEYEMVEAGAYKGAKSVKSMVDQCHAHMQNPANNHGWLGLQYLWTPRIVFSADGNRARAQFNQLSPHSMAVSEYPSNFRRFVDYWFIGKYDNEYIRIDEEWKILKVHVCAQSRTPCKQGWIRQADARRITHDYDSRPDGLSRIYTYHPDAFYSAEGGVYTYQPFLPEDGSF